MTRNPDRARAPRRLPAALLALATALAAPPLAALAPPPADVRALSRLSLEELASLEVTSVAKTAQSLGTAPAAVYVITREEILRQGARSIPEALRLAPNLQVIQYTSGDYAITARGFGGNPDVQNFSNKILILIDGRSVYSPLFSGVAYDAQDVLMDDIDRIEVISGPGATLWGANAMNGVINILTRSARDTTGALVRAAAGNVEDLAAARYGAELGDHGAWRVYAKGYARDEMERPDGSGAGDDWDRGQVGFRLDLDLADDEFTLQGDYYQGARGQAVAPDVDFSGRNLLARLLLRGGAVQTRLQAYHDRTVRDRPVDGVSFTLDTWDFEAQQNLAAGRHNLVWGAGGRTHHYRIGNEGALRFEPAERTLHLANLFLQDVVRLTGDLELTAGLKLERDGYGDWTALPDLRLRWMAGEQAMLWASVSGAIRAPTPFDVDVVELVEDEVFLRGNPGFQSEKVTVYELGYRGRPLPSVTLSVAAHFDVLDDLRTIEPGPVDLLPLRWGNGLEGEAYGLEAWATIQVLPWWQLSPGFATLHRRLDFKPGASGLLGPDQAGNDPDWFATLKSSMNLGCCVNLDANLRYVDELPNPVTGSYYELSARLGWRVSDHVEVAIAGSNLLRSRHREYAAPAGLEIRRAVLAEARVMF